MYKDWDGIVYPKPKPARFDQLQYIAELFDTIEINSSFYGPPVAKTASSWVHRVEEHDRVGRPGRHRGRRLAGRRHFHPVGPGRRRILVRL